MTKNEYLINLAVALEKDGVGTDEIKRTVEFCGEMMDDMMDDGMTEEQAVSSMGEPEEIAARMREEGEQEEEQEEVQEEITEPFFEEEKTSGNGYQRFHRTFDPASIKEISVIDSNNAISMEKGYEFSVDYTNAGDDVYAVGISDGVLTVKYVPRAKKMGFLWNIFSGSARRDKVVVTVPDNWHGRASLRTGNSSIEVRDVSLSDLTAHTSNSSVTAERVKAVGNVVLRTSNSRVSAEDVEAEKVTIKTNNARIEGKNVRAAGNVTFVSSNGRITAENVSGKDMVLSTSNGKIEVMNIGAQYIKLATSNGGISGTVAGKRGDYRITSRTSNGKNNLEGSDSGSRTLEVITSNGGINVDFAE